MRLTFWPYGTLNYFSTMAIYSRIQLVHRSADKSKQGHYTQGCYNRNHCAQDIADGKQLMTLTCGENPYSSLSRAKWIPILQRLVRSSANVQHNSTKAVCLEKTPCTQPHIRIYIGFGNEITSGQIMVMCRVNLHPWQTRRDLMGEYTWLVCPNLLGSSI
jgi:hypothetical protein